MNSFDNEPQIVFVPFNRDMLAAGDYTVCFLDYAVRQPAILCAEPDDDETDILAGLLGEDVLCVLKRA